MNASSRCSIMLVLVSALVSSACVGWLDNSSPAAEPEASEDAGVPEQPDAFETPDAAAPAEDCAPIEQFFENEVWAKVAEPTCINCHVEGGAAAGSDLVLRASAVDPDYLSHNFAAFEALAKEPVDSHEGRARLLVMATGGLEHPGGMVVSPGSRPHEILETFVERVNDPQICEPGEGYEPGEFFESVTMISDQRLLRRITLALGARLPSPEEILQVDADGLEAIAPIMDGLMKEEAFYTRLMEGFNDIILTQGYEGPSEMVLSYTHFRNTRDWPGYNVPYEVWANYRDAIRREPLELIAYIVRNNRPFTEVLTADYMVVSPYTARGYGVYDLVDHLFEDPEDPFEFVAVRMPALTTFEGEPAQESPTGYYPHAGLLTTFQYSKRYPTTATNRNRLRSNTFYRLFMGIDILESAPLASDSASIDTQFDNPTMEAPDCVVCHKRLDPVAGLFQDFDESGYFSPPDNGWHTDMFAPGFDGEQLPESEKWRALQWLGERAAKDSRFAVAMVEHVYQILFGRRVLAPPKDVNDPLFDARRRAYRKQRELIEQTATAFVESDFDIKEIFKALVVSRFYRAGGLEAPVDDPERLAEIDDLGVVAMLTPEQLDRKLKAVFGRTYEPLMHSFQVLYGGIDSSQITERLLDPSGPMGAIQRIVANDIACQVVPEEFQLPANERVFFSNIEPDVRPDGGPEAQAKIRQTIVDLHYRILGRELAPDDPQVDRTYSLFEDLVAEGLRQIGTGEVRDRGSYHCSGPQRDPSDPHFTVRAWRAVIIYMIRQHAFLYQ